MVAFYAFSLSVIAYGYNRINKGLETTYLTRKAIVTDTFRVVIAYMLYMSITAVFLVVYASYVRKGVKSESQRTYDDRVAFGIEKLVAYIVACRGLVDATLWFILHDFAKEPEGARTGVLGSRSARLMDRLRFLPLTTTGSSTASNDPAPAPPARANAPKSHEEEEADIDLTPQLNIALRQEMLHFVTVGIQQSVKRRLESLGQESHSFLLDERYKFTDYHPSDFQRLRALMGITEDMYLEQISQPAKEKLSEGASGAFMFYCGTELIVKTVKKSEARTLQNILDYYRRHLERTPDSLLVRFYGLHSLKMYSQEFNFVVMGNVFPKTAVINERYDIKGSWVNRNAGVAAPGTKAFCRHCNEFFVVGSNIGCPEIVGPHESNIVLKDNDLSSKIRMRPEDAFKLIEVINRDSDALAVMGIMDYSLLIGVRNLQYDVDPENLLRKLEAAETAAPPAALLHRSKPDSDTGLPSSVTSPMHPSASATSISTLLPVPSAHRETSDRYLGGYLSRAVIAPGVYYLGIIDILQTWTFKKQIE
eukprot:gene1516-1758_t